MISFIITTLAIYVGGMFVVGFLMVIGVLD